MRFFSDDQESRAVGKGGRAVHEKKKAKGLGIDYGLWEHDVGTARSSRWRTSKKKSDEATKPDGAGWLFRPSYHLRVPSKTTQTTQTTRPVSTCARRATFDRFAFRWRPMGGVETLALTIVRDAHTGMLAVDPQQLPVGSFRARP